MANSAKVKLGIDDAICQNGSFVFTIGNGVNLNAMRYESVSLNGVVADRSYRVMLCQRPIHTMQFVSYDSFVLLY